MAFSKGQYLNLASRAGAAFLCASALLLGAAATARAQTGALSALAFSHEPHRSVSCLTCHDSDAGKVGQVRVTEQQCMACHHTGPAAQSCTHCHEPAELARPYQTVQRLQLSVTSTPITRTLVLSHQQHSDVRCQACHQQPPRLAATSLACSSCHQQHHTPDADCESCHDARAVPAHNNASHLGCGGAGCHSDNPVPASTRSRSFCLTCHTDRSQHYPASGCVDCHAMPMRGAGQR